MLRNASKHPNVVSNARYYAKDPSLAQQYDPVYVQNIIPSMTSKVLYMPIILIMPLFAYAIGLMSGCGTASNLLNWSL